MVSTYYALNKNIPTLLYSSNIYVVPLKMRGKINEIFKLHGYECSKCIFLMNANTECKNIVHCALYTMHQLNLLYSCIIIIIYLGIKMFGHLKWHK